MWKGGLFLCEKSYGTSPGILVGDAGPGKDRADIVAFPPDSRCQEMDFQL